MAAPIVNDKFVQPGTLPADLDPNIRSAIQSLREQANTLLALVKALEARVYKLEHP